MLEDDLSEQHLMDCGYDGETMIGCDGAFVFAYVEWIIWNNDGLVEKVSGIDYDNDYDANDDEQESCAPYFGEEMTCNDDDTCNYADAQVILNISLEKRILTPATPGDWHLQQLESQ